MTKARLGEMRELDCAHIRPMPGQPRFHFDKLEMDHLTASIVKVGQRRAITVREVAEDRYELVDGERRWRVCKKLGRPVVAWVKPVTDAKDQFLESVVSNFCSAPHDELEIYEAVKRIRAENEYTLEETSKVFGHTVTWVSMYVSLGKLAPEIRQLLSRSLPDGGRLQFSHAIEVARLPVQQQMAMVNRIFREELNQAQVKHAVSIILAGSPESRRMQPAKERTKLENFVARTKRDLEIWMQQTPQHLCNILFSVDTFQRDGIMNDIAGMIDDLQGLQDVLKRKVLGKEKIAS